MIVNCCCMGCNINSLSNNVLNMSHLLLAAFFLLLDFPKAAKDEKVLVDACGDVDDDDDDDDMEQEEMFVDAHESFEHQVSEWGGPRRGGRLPEPTRFGDWERKGRCTDF